MLWLTPSRRLAAPFYSSMTSCTHKVNSSANSSSLKSLRLSDWPDHFFQALFHYFCSQCLCYRFDNLLVGVLEVFPLHIQESRRRRLCSCMLDSCILNLSATNGKSEFPWDS